MPISSDFNAVLAAQSLNPSIFTQTWLAKFKLFEESDFSKNSLYSPLAVNVATQDLLFVAIPEKVQVAFAHQKEDAIWCQRTLHRTIGVIARELHHTPFQAIGFNIEWGIKLKPTQSIESTERRSFLTDLNPLSKHFQDISCRFGLYLSKPFALGRLKLDIKPVTFRDDSAQGTRLLFNFHLDLAEDKDSLIPKFLDLWPEAYETSRLYATELEAAWDLI